MAEPITLALRGPGGEPVDLWRTLTSHGFFDLPPLRVDEDARTLDVTLRPARGAPRRVRIRAGAPGTALVEPLGRGTVSAAARTALATGGAHVLRLDQDLSAFYAKAAEDPDLAWVTSGAGRMLRSPTVWEDVVKTVCTVFGFLAPRVALLTGSDCRRISLSGVPPPCPGRRAQRERARARRSTGSSRPPLPARTPT
ncbi:MAG: hypothetical protein ACXVWF_05790, partial [Actinomycetota bacterium]